jgi:hypothetical protein
MYVDLLSYNALFSKLLLIIDAVVVSAVCFTCVHLCSFTTQCLRSKGELTRRIYYKYIVQETTTVQGAVHRRSECEYTRERTTDIQVTAMKENLFNGIKIKYLLWCNICENIVLYNARFKKLSF